MTENLIPKKIHYCCFGGNPIPEYNKKIIAESGIKNKTTSLKLYITTFRKWQIFETPRSKVRYLYHFIGNLLHI